MTNVAAKSDGKCLARHIETRVATADRSRNPKVGAAVRHLRDLAKHPAGLREGLVDLPQWAASADTGEMEIGCRLSFGDIAGTIDPHKEEGDAASIGALERRKPMADRFEADPEPAPELFDIIGLGLGGGEEITIGEDECSREIVGQTHPGQSPRFVARQQTAIGQLVDDAAQFQKCQLGRHLEGLLALMQVGGDVQCPSRGIIAALSRIALTPDNLNIVTVLQPRNESRVDRVRRKTGLSIYPLSCLI